MLSRTNRLLFWMCWGVLAFALAPDAKAITALTHYAEVGEAGDRFNPQPITEGPYIGFTGLIGGNDLKDAFLFYFDGGTLGFTAHYEGEDPQNPLYLSLWSDPFGDALAQGPTSLIATVGAGNYILQVALIAADPIYFIDFEPTVPPFLIDQPRLIIPEPATAVLVILGAGALARLRPRRRAAP